MDYTQKRIRTVAQKFDVVDGLEHLNQTSKIGVPYLIPALHLARIAHRWIEVLDSFEELEWIDIMHAFGLALAVEGLAARTTRMMTNNYDPLKRLDRGLIHYCYGDWRWDKRAFTNGRSPLHTTPMPSTEGLAGTVLGEMLTQIRQARAYNRSPRLLGAIWRLAGAVSG
jgi:hypothetical protein